MAELRPVRALDVAGVLQPERAALVELLAALEEPAWALPTECPAWTVKGIALHLLGDDLSLLSRQRDAAPSGLRLLAAQHADWTLPQLLSNFNEGWVQQASFMSPQLLIEMLNFTGRLTAEFYRTVDPELRGEPVHLAGPEPAPYWLLAARELVERWVHHMQIARAVNQPGPVNQTVLMPVVAAIMWILPRHMPLFAAHGEQVTITIEPGDVSWTLSRDGHKWKLYDGAPPAPTARVQLASSFTAALFSRGLTLAAATDGIATSGERDLAEQVRDWLAAFNART